MRRLCALGATVMLAACASTTGSGADTARISDKSPFSYVEEYEALKSQCAAREGYLEPLGGSGTGRPVTDYACRVRGGTTDLFRPAR